jgi:hypothetical protein
MTARQWRIDESSLLSAKRPEQFSSYLPWERWQPCQRAASLANKEYGRQGCRLSRQNEDV